MKKTENFIFNFTQRPVILSSAASVGKTESEGPLKDEFDILNPDDGLKAKSWESAEAELVHQAADLALKKAGLTDNNIGIAFAGDLLNQCTASTFGFRNSDIPLAGLFGACSTFALALCLASLCVDGGYAEYALAASSSHFCGAEKQFRFPLEYGGQRSQTAQRTVTGSGACVVGASGRGAIVTKGMVGRITDLGVKDAANMGAAMAPAAKRSITDFLRYTKTSPEDYDLILTGDLGSVGTKLLKELILGEEGIDISGVHADCGNMIFDAEKQDSHAGGSGCGCSASVVCSKILKDIYSGRLKKVLFAGTGALMSPLTSLQGESIPAITHIVLLENDRKEG